jgi:hypothetical protein
MPQPSALESTRRNVVSTFPRSPAHFIPWSLTMPGVITPVKPVFRKSSEPDPRLARLAEKIEQVRHARALRFRRPTQRREDLH